MINTPLLWVPNYSSPYLPVNYGYHYNGYFAAHALAAPAGWHIPTASEVGTLMTYLNSLVGSFVEGDALKESGLTNWFFGNSGNNITGFTAIGSGRRSVTTGGVNNGYKGQKAEFYMPALFGAGYALFLEYNKSTIGFGLLAGFSTEGLAIRMIKNDSTLADMTDSDGNVYPAVKIGTQVWTAVDFRCTKYNDGSPIAKVDAYAAWFALGSAAYCIPPWTT